MDKGKGGLVAQAMPPSIPKSKQFLRYTKIKNYKVLVPASSKIFWPLTHSHNNFWFRPVTKDHEQIGKKNDWDKIDIELVMLYGMIIVHFFYRKFGK